MSNLKIITSPSVFLVGQSQVNEAELSRFLESEDVAGWTTEFPRETKRFGLIARQDSDMMIGPTRGVVIPTPTTSQPFPWEGKTAMHHQSTIAPVEYKDIPGFPGYRVGDDGSVWSCKKRVGFAGGWTLSDEWRSMRIHVGKQGYQQVCLYQDKRVSRRLVHHLVLEAFVGPRPSGYEGCHFPNEDRTDNRLGNLRWDTRSGNMADRVSHGTSNRGIHRNGNVKLTIADIKAIRDLDANGTPRREIGRQFNIDKSYVCRIVNRQRWGYVA